MNFLCHAIPYLDQPILAACTGVPDLLSVIDRKIRARARSAEPFLQDDDPVMRQVAGGIVAHVRDDRWFHGGKTFARMNLEFAVALRDRLPDDAGFRPSFVGHILIEMLLDANYVIARPELVRQYYDQFETLPLDRIGDCVNRITGKPTSAIPETFRRFAEVKFLLDYETDATLMFRLNQIMKRVGLAALPDEVRHWLPQARQDVLNQHDRLLSPADSGEVSDPTFFYPTL